ncbi:uncharacterized protein LOC115631791 [Scaptodrosophila lebanonensis]|uniref:Uncharacterized protein LOC115631791 n=1 Tax=Drosophila lebanonensis TaxID=7225 RepID=A0A6J2UBB8_DROLE|nr:uncharacterized protein LOC115631791 [Scaptodrosophila lebanonensis]XP_030384487.1 uncharacterized protein LOC115631791 [Scaptodrosophila lebanonensis]
MEASLVLAMVIVVFCHWIGLTYLSSNDASLASTIFIIIAMMGMHKIMLKRGGSDTFRNKVFEATGYCVVMDVVLSFVWEVGVKTMQFLVGVLFDMLRATLSAKFHWLPDMVQPTVTPLALLAIEVFAFLKCFEINDMQQFFGCEDDRLSESMLSLLAEQERRFWRREHRRMMTKR